MAADIAMLVSNYVLKQPAYPEKYVVDSVVDNTVTQVVDYCYGMHDEEAGIASYSEAVNSSQATE